MATIKTKSNLIHLDAERIARRGDKPMEGTETLDELLGVPYANLERLANRHGRGDLFTRVDIGEWDRFRLPERTGWGYAA